MKITLPEAVRPRGIRRWWRPGAWRGVLAVLALVLLVIVGHHLLGARGPADRTEPATPVAAKHARLASVPVWIDTLGTVTARNDVSVMPRVTGMLKAVRFRDGTMVKAGEVLAEIDPAPFVVAVDQARGQLAHDQALLAGARTDLSRYEALLSEKAIAAQQVSDQRATVVSLRASVAADQASLSGARLQLSYTRITAPISGLAGLRQVDPGNLVTPSGVVRSQPATTTTAGSVVPIVTIAQVQPILVTFAVTQDQLPAILEQVRSGAQLPVEAWDQRDKRRIATGQLLAVDNELNPQTGTVTLEARFANRHLRLFPNEFVNAHLRVTTLENVVTVPSEAIGTGAPGAYVYVIGDDHKVILRQVVTGVSYDGETVVTKGVVAGDDVVTDGLDRLRNKSLVRVVSGQAGSTTRHGG